MRIVNFIVAILYLALAFSSVNSPDPVIWILIYGTLSAIAIMAMFEMYLNKLVIGMAILLVGYSFFFLEGFTEWTESFDVMGLFKTEPEIDYTEARRFIGLVISEIVLIYYFVNYLRLKRIHQPEQN